jgi:hypothetical protein
MATTESIMSFDPGGTTGYTIRNLARRGRSLSSGTSYDYNGVWRGGQLGPRTHHRELWQLLTREDPDRIVCEDFVYRIVKNQGVAQPGIQLVSREYIGVIKLYCALTNKPLHMQPSSVISLAWTADDALRKLGIYMPGEQHRNDATRHLLYFAVETLGRKDILLPLRTNV